MLRFRLILLQLLAKVSHIVFSKCYQQKYDKKLISNILNFKFSNCWFKLYFGSIHFFLIGKDNKLCCINFYWIIRPTFVVFITRINLKAVSRFVIYYKITESILQNLICCCFVILMMQGGFSTSH